MNKDENNGAKSLIGDVFRRLFGGKPPATAADREWADAIAREHLDAEFGMLNIFVSGRNAGLDYGSLRCGGYYRCRHTFEANGGGRLESGEGLWFVGYYVLPYDGVHRLHFNDGMSERLMTFVDIYPESDALICSAFKEDPAAWFEPAEGPPGKTAALLALRRKVIALRKTRRHPDDLDGFGPKLD